MNKEILFKKISQSIKSYRSELIRDENQEGLELIDILNYPFDKTVATAEKEIESLIEHIYIDILYSG